VGENPGMGAVEIYGHAAGNRGFIFLVNPNYWDRTVEVPLDTTLGFTGAGQCEIAELYPVKRLRLTAEGPWPAFGGRLPMNVPAQQVVVLEVRPAPSEIDAPRLYGLPGTIEISGSGYRVKTSGLQGRTERFAIMLPRGSQAPQLRFWTIRKNPIPGFRPLHHLRSFRAQRRARYSRSPSGGCPLRRS
jgi:hypothetical protein